jgi:hypothetical protein
MSEALFTETLESGQLLARRVQQSLHVILAGLEERASLSSDETEDLRRDLRTLLHRERVEIAIAEFGKAEEILAYMIRPAIEECLSLWFGKPEQTDQEIWSRFGGGGRARIPWGVRPLGPRRGTSAASGSW